LATLPEKPGLKSPPTEQVAALSDQILDLRQLLAFVVSAMTELVGGDDLVAAAAPFGLIPVVVTPRFLASLALAADVGFFGRSDTAKQPGIVFHHGAAAVAKEARGLLTDADMRPSATLGCPLLETATTSASAGALNGQRPG
jgi:hypothetical protein